MPESGGCESCKFDAPEVPAAETTGKTVITKLTLVGTKTCPNCKMAAAKLEVAGKEFDMVYADESPEFIKEFKILSAPVLLVPQAEGEVRVISNLSNILGYINE